MQSPNFVLIGAGIMSATLATLYHELFPDHKIIILERLNEVAEESSSSWNNAGTGHSGFCELNYTPEQENGNINIDKAVKVAEQFELSKQFWTYLIDQGKLDDNDLFIHPVAHCSLVYGQGNIDFLKRRVQKMIENPLFEGMLFSNQQQELSQWFPLITEDNMRDNEMAASKMDLGTDVEFGKLTHQLFDDLVANENVELWLEHDVYDIDRDDNGQWKVEYKNLASDKKSFVNAPYVFVGAGGGALKLLNKAEIDEVDGFGGFPVGGKWLKCNNPKVIAQHHAKVYGKAEIGAPPMSVPHLDSRIINGEKQLLFGPYAGFSTKFLKKGSLFDWPESLDFDNIIPMIEVGLDNIPLTKYLIDQVRMNFDDKFKELQKYYPDAKKEDWELLEAGQRVQIIKKDKEGDGVLEFGTEVVITQDKTLSGLLGASPGASTAPAIMLALLPQMFENDSNREKVKTKLKEIFPSYGILLSENPELLHQIREHCNEVLKIGENYISK